MSCTWWLLLLLSVTIHGYHLGRRRLLDLGGEWRSRAFHSNYIFTFFPIVPEINIGVEGHPVEGSKKETERRVETRTQRRIAHRTHVLFDVIGVHNRALGGAKPCAGARYDDVFTSWRQNHDSHKCGPARPSRCVG